MDGDSYRPLAHKVPNEFNKMVDWTSGVFDLPYEVELARCGYGCRATGGDHHGSSAPGSYNRLHIRLMPDGYDVVIHYLADPDMPVGEAHHLADDLEKQLRASSPKSAVCWCTLSLKLRSRRDVLIQAGFKNGRNDE
jgi:hypothetical protein